MEGQKSNNSEESPLWEAMERKRPKLSSMLELLESGYDPNETWDPLWYSKTASLGIVVMWVPEYEYRTSPLFSTVIDNDIESAALLIKYGANVERQSEKGLTALHLAVKLMKRDFIKFLVEVGANINASTNDSNSASTVAGCSALHYAVLSARLDIVQDLLRLGADVQPTSAAGWSILDIAILNQRPEIVDYLLRTYPSFKSTFVPSPHLPLTDANEISQQELDRELAHHLLTTGARGTDERHTEVFRKCLRQAWSRIERDISSGANVEKTISEIFWNCLRQAWSLVGRYIFSGGNVGKIISEEVEAILMTMAGVSDQLSWDQRFCEACTSFVGQDYQRLVQQFKHSSDISCLRQTALLGCLLCQILIDGLERHAGPNAAVFYNSSGEGYNISTCVEFPDAYTGVRYTGVYASIRPRGRLVVRCNKIRIQMDLGIVDEETRKAIFKSEPDDVHGSRSIRSLTIAKAWLDHCELHHDRCRSDTLQCLPPRVIAVGDAQTEPFLHNSTGTTARYTALSYCWGGTASLRTTTANFEQHLHTLSFRAMPQTIQDAITITRALGIQYLWVDSLCIIQDSADDFIHQFALMDKIYANATVTIAAKEAPQSAAGCLYDSERKSTAMLPLNFIFPAGGKDQPVRKLRINKAMLIPRFDADAERKEKAVLDSRGWTWQEQILSRRIINCWKKELSWTCFERNCSETNFSTLQFNHNYPDPKDEVYVTRLALAKQITHTRTPLKAADAFRQWLEVVEEYTTRQLSDPEDKLRALAGLQNRFASILLDTPILGGWRDHYFWPSLLWYSKNDQQQIISTDPSYPSWAWPSVQGPIGFLGPHLGPTSSFDPVLIEWRLHIVKEDVKINGSIRVKCRLLPWSAFDVEVEELNRHDKSDPNSEESPEEACEVSDGDKIVHRSYYFMPIVNVPWKKTTGFRLNPNRRGTPASVVFMVLEKIDPDQMHFRKVALWQKWEKNGVWRKDLQDAVIDIF